LGYSDIRIATYNVNGINARLPVLLGWLADARPDVACLQELKGHRGGTLRTPSGVRGITRSITGRRAGTGWPSPARGEGPVAATARGRRAA
jgi:exodeoxyribonuclease III